MALTTVPSRLLGQEVNPETRAVSESDLLMKDPTGRDADNVAFGTTLSDDADAARSLTISSQIRPKTTKADYKHGSRRESHSLWDRPEIEWPCGT